MNETFETLPRRLSRRDLLRLLAFGGVSLALGLDCASEKKPEKLVDLEGAVIDELYLSAAERRDVASEYYFTVKTLFGVKSVRVEDVLVGNQWLKKEGIAAAIKSGDRVRLTSVPEQYLNYSTFSIGASNIRILPRE